MIKAIWGLAKVFEWMKKMKSFADNFSEMLGSSENQEEMQEIILQEISAAIDESGLQTVTGHLKSSFKFVGVEKTQTGITYKVISTARYASYLNDGSAPSYGRFVPAIGRRLVNSSRGSIGMHPGNRPYRFMEIARQRVINRARPTLTQQVLNYVKKWLG